jgi:LEA14-like dessication related protein
MSTTATAIAGSDDIGKQDGAPADPQINSFLLVLIHAVRIVCNLTMEDPRMKRAILAAVIMVCVIVPGTAFTIPKPTASIQKFDIDSISLRDITFLFDVSVKNPYPVDLKLAGVKIKFSVEGKQFFETETSKGFRIKSNGSASNVFTVNLKYADIIKIVKSYAQQDYLDTTIDTEIVVPLPSLAVTMSLPKTLSFKYTLHKKIPAIKPDVSIANFAIVPPSAADIAAALKKAGKQSIDAGKARSMFEDILAGKKPQPIIDPASLDLKLTTNFDIVLRNDTKAQLAFKDLGYTFAVGGSNLVDGKTTNITKSGNAQILRVTNVFSTRSLAGPLASALKNRKGDFAVKGSTFIKLPDEIKKEPVKLQFDESGSFSIK